MPSPRVWVTLVVGVVIVLSVLRNAAQHSELSTLALNLYYPITTLICANRAIHNPGKQSSLMGNLASIQQQYHGVINSFYSPAPPAALVPSTSLDPSTPPPGRFLFVVNYHEQLTKAKMAFEEIIWLAKSLNRTLVLPRVGSSTLGIKPPIHRLPLSLYFNSTAISNHLSTISFEDFARVTRLRFDRSILFPPTKGRHYSCLDGAGHLSESTKEHVVKHYEFSFRVARSLCLDRKIPLLQAQQILSTFTDEPTLVFPGYRAADFVWTEKNDFQVDFAPALYQEAERYSSTTMGSSYLAAHWRTETTRAQRCPLKDCAIKLIPFIQSKLKELNMTRFYLATDLGPQTKSVTFHAQQDFTDVYTHISRTLQPNSYVPNDRIFNTHGDSGVVGILEKLICVKASYFLGLQGNCAKHSSYTEDIALRRKALGTGDSQLEWKVKKCK